MYGHKSPLDNTRYSAAIIARVTQKGDPGSKKAVRFRISQGIPALLPHKQSSVYYCHHHSGYVNILIVIISTTSVVIDIVSVLKRRSRLINFETYIEDLFFAACNTQRKATKLCDLS